MTAAHAGQTGGEREAQTFAQFLDAWRVRSRMGDWRHGQALFNLLHSARPELAEQLHGTAIDPFYNDVRVIGALSWIGDHWEDPR